MNWLNIHRSRHKSNGGNMKEVYKNDTITYINQTFDQSPSHAVIIVDGKEMDARVIQEREYQVANEYEMKRMLLRPLTLIDRGAYVVHEEDTYLNVFFHKDDLYPKAFIRFCNNQLVFEDGSIYPCVIDNKIQRFQTVNENMTVLLPSDTLAIFVQSNNHTRKIKRLHRFVINEQAWEVQAVDITSCTFKGVGVVEMVVKQVPLKDEELPETIPPTVIIPNKDYHVEIQGIDDVEMGTSALFLGVVYLDSIPTQEIVTWSVIGDGSIDATGLFTASNNPSETMIVATYEYLDNNGSLVRKEATKKIKVFDNNDWEGWG